MNSPSSGSQKNTFGKNYTLVDSQIHGEYDQQRFNSVRHSYDGLCKRLYIIFSVPSVHIDLFARPAVFPTLLIL